MSSPRTCHLWAGPNATAWHCSGISTMLASLPVSGGPPTVVISDLLNILNTSRDVFSVLS